MRRIAIGRWVTRAAGRSWRQVWPRRARGNRRRPPAWRHVTAELLARAAIVLRICPWGWHRRLPGSRLPQRVARAYRLGSFRALWAVEALGFRYAATSPALAAGEPPARLPGAELPAESLLMLHVGLGMALARRALAACGSALQTSAAVDRFLEHAEASALPGYLDAVAEPLGVVARYEHARRVAAIGWALGRRAPELVPWYWHGVGRCHLFLPASFLPLAEASWRAARRLAREVPAGAARRHARVGWSCGLTLVHMRQPWLVADLLRRHGAEIESAADGFAADFREGVAEAVDLRREVTPGSGELVEAFLAHRPAAGRRTADRWRRLVEQPGLTALAAPAIGGETALSQARAAARRMAASPGGGLRGAAEAAARATPPSARRRQREEWKPLAWRPGAGYVGRELLRVPEDLGIARA
jgi:hypothetical protein